MAGRGDALATHKTTINVLLFIVIILSSSLVLSIYGLLTSRDNFTISIPPNLQNGAIVNVDEFNLGVVHAFAYNTFREVNRWENDGFIDYGAKIDELAPRFTEPYYEYLKKDMNRKNALGQLKDRTRYALETRGTLYDHELDEDAVTVVNGSTWIVNVEVDIVERIADFEIKTRSTRYPLLVRRGNISPEKNIWGLLIDGYPEGQAPEVLEGDVEETDESATAN